jgi:hypothetical protein
MMPTIGIRPNFTKTVRAAVTGFTFFLKTKKLEGLSDKFQILKMVKSQRC